LNLCHFICNAVYRSQTTIEFHLFYIFNSIDNTSKKIIVPSREGRGVGQYIQEKGMLENEDYSLTASVSWSLDFYHHPPHNFLKKSTDR